MSFSSVVSSPAAFLPSSRARSRPSRFDNDAPLAQGGMEHRALDLAPLRDMSLARHDHVGRHAQRVQDSTQPYHLIEAARHVALDYEKVEIALGIGLSPSVGTEQDHPGGRLRGSRQELSGAFDELLGGHLAHGTAGIGA